MGVSAFFPGDMKKKSDTAPSRSKSSSEDGGNTKGENTLNPWLTTTASSSFFWTTQTHGNDRN